MASSTSNITFEIKGVCCGRTTIGFFICYSRHHLCAPFTWRRRTFVGGGIFGIHNFTRTGASKTHEFFQVTVAPTWCCLFFYFILACFNGCFFGVGGTWRGLVQKIASRVRWKDLYVHHVHTIVKSNKITIFGWMDVLLKFPKNMSLTGTSCGMTNWLSNADIRSIYCCGVHVLSLGGFSTLLHWLHRNEGVKMREKQSNWTKSGWSVFLCRVWGVVQWPCVQTTYHNVSLPRTLYCGRSRIYNEGLRLVGSSGSSMDRHSKKKLYIQIHLLQDGKKNIEKKK